MEDLLEEVVACSYVPSTPRVTKSLVDNIRISTVNTSPVVAHTEVIGDDAVFKTHSGVYVMLSVERRPNLHPQPLYMPHSGNDMVTIIATNIINGNIEKTVTVALDDLWISNSIHRRYGVVYPYVLIPIMFHGGRKGKSVFVLDALLINIELGTVDVACSVERGSLPPKSTGYLVGLGLIDDKLIIGDNSNRVIYTIPIGVGSRPFKIWVHQLDNHCIFKLARNTIYCYSPDIFTISRYNFGDDGLLLKTGELCLAGCSLSMLGVKSSFRNVELLYVDGNLILGFFQGIGHHHTWADCDLFMVDSFLTKVISKAILPGTIVMNNEGLTLIKTLPFFGTVGLRNHPTYGHSVVVLFTIMKGTIQFFTREFPVIARFRFRKLPPGCRNSMLVECDQSRAWGRACKQFVFMRVVFGKG